MKRFKTGDSPTGAVSRVFYTSFLFLLAVIFLCGCVRLTGSAGYWKTDPEGETKSKRAAFDTAEFLPGSPHSGSITV
ncbi:MAG: hypothetical protein BWY42_01158 [Candidatus Omnitrophica bacterium ADurb.Bin277]|nr:MAG: hypothetical protein BWY42_01158 [Candidatus Omnitrophica bacterium ADurb.Bin277]